MTTHHHWFRSGTHTLLSHIHLPLTPPAHSGVVIVPPFGWDDICSYRPLRSLARNLALNGIPTLRFDLPGTGDSSGSALDQKLIPAWIQSIQAAAAELKAATGVHAVSILGVRLGAMLALAAAAAGTQVESLILWGASATGHAVLRELEAFRNLELTEYAQGEVPPPQPIEGLEVAGFLLSPETKSALDALSAIDLPPLTDQRVLLLSRDNFPHDRRLVQSLERAGCQLTLKPGMGYQKMMAAPHDSVPFSPETQSTILQFLETNKEKKQFVSLPPVIEKFRPEHSCRLEEGIGENVCLQQYRGRSLFSILAKPAAGLPSSDWGLLFINAGAVRHIGPNRMWVEVARRWAARGIPSMRLDFQRVGESDGDLEADIASLHGDDLVEQLGTVMNTMQLQLNCRRFIAIGLCSGAFAAFHSVIRDPAIRGAVLLNPRQFFWDPALESRRLAKRLGVGFGNVSYWRRLARREVQPERVKQAAQAAFKRLLRCRPMIGQERQIPSEALAQAWKQVKQFRTRVTLVFADGEPLFDEMLDEKQLPDPTDPLIRCVRVGKVGHTVRPLWAQQLVHDLIDREIDITIQEGANRHETRRLPERLSALA